MTPAKPLTHLGQRITVRAKDIRQLAAGGIKHDYAELSLGTDVLRYTIPSPLIRSRVETLFTREPTTAAWIASFDRNDVFVDVGANFGLYSIYAAIARGVTVHCFEPESQNYAELNRNIFLNGLHERVTAYCVALADVNEMSRLYLCTFAVGFGHHDFGANSWKDDLHRGTTVYPKDSRFRQGAVGMTLDDLVESGALPVPNHIKIDVDAFEWKVVKGAWRTLARPEVKSVLVEIDFSMRENVEIIETMLDHGWQYSDDQIRVFENEVLSVDDVNKIVKGSVGQQNFIFFRDGDKYRRLFAEFVAGLQ